MYQSFSMIPDRIENSSPSASQLRSVRVAHDGIERALAQRLGQMSNCYCLPGRAGDLPLTLGLVAAPVTIPD